MSEPTNEEMLGWFNGLMDTLTSEPMAVKPNASDMRIIDAIRRRIRRAQPKVRMEFVEEWAKELCGLRYWGAMSSLLLILREAGVEVEGKAEEE